LRDEQPRLLPSKSKSPNIGSSIFIAPTCYEIFKIP
jgi:hypothetical protein